MSAGGWRNLAAGEYGGERATCALLFPSCLYGRIMQHVSPSASRLGGAPLRAGALYCLLSPLGALTAPLCVCPMNLRLRMATFPREPECKSIALSWCCAPCSLAEIERSVTDDDDAIADGGGEDDDAMASPGAQRMCSTEYCSTRS